MTGGIEQTIMRSGRRSSKRCGHRISLCLVEGGDLPPIAEPAIGEPEHSADEEGGQKTSNRPERTVPGITAAGGRSVGGVPRKAHENEGLVLFYLVRRFWIGSTFHP